MEEKLSPTCTFALSVLAEHAQNADSVPEEALDAARQHVATCEYCKLASGPTNSAPRKKRKTRKTTIPAPTAPDTPAATLSEATGKQVVTATTDNLRVIDCQQCQELLPEYATALDREQSMEQLYPEVQDHLATCEGGCAFLLELLQHKPQKTQNAQTKLHNPFNALMRGFWRKGPITLSGRALSYSMLILLLGVGALGTYLGYTWNTSHNGNDRLAVPDGIGLSDGLKVFDACNNTAFQKKRAAAQELHERNMAKAQSLLGEALDTAHADTSGCNEAEAAIYRQDLSIRQSGRPYNMVIVGFDSDPGRADLRPDQHTLYAASTQELIGAYIGQQQYNATQEKTTGAPLLYLVLANTAGSEIGAEQLTRAISTLAKGDNGQQFDLLVGNAHPLLGVMGFGPGNLTQIMLPTLCRAGVPLIAPTDMEQFIANQLTQISLYRHCAPGFAFVRFAPDTGVQGRHSATYAYNELKAHDAAIFYDPANPTSNETAQNFADSFLHFSKTRIVARETVLASHLQDGKGEAQDGMQSELNDALSNNPQVIFAPLLTSDVTNLAHAIAHLPADQQPTLLIGGAFVQPAALQELTQWARMEQLTLPPIYVVAASAARPPIEGDWQKQFYTIFCTSFAHPGSYCSGAAALEQGTLLFGDGVTLIAQSVGPVGKASQILDRAQMVKRLNGTTFAGVSGDIALKLHGDVLITNEKAAPVILTLQQDGSIQVL